MGGLHVSNGLLCVLLGLCGSPTIPGLRNPVDGSGISYYDCLWLAVSSPLRIREPAACFWTSIATPCRPTTLGPPSSST